MNKLGSLAIIFILTSPAVADMSWEGSTGFPQLLRVGKYGKPMGEFDGYWNAGFMKFSISRVGLESYGIEAGLRTQPFWEKFFGSMSFGWSSFTGAANVSSVQIDGAAVANEISVQLLGFYFRPSIGAKFAISDSLDYGFDIGLQVPLLAWGFIAADGNTSFVNQGAAIQRLAYLPIPQITLVRLSWK